MNSSDRCSRVPCSFLWMALAAVHFVLYTSTLAAEPVSRIIDRIAERIVEEGLVAGMSIGVAEGDRSVHARGYGMADRENETPAGPDTIYRIGSLTKQFTAAAIMQLVEQGALRLNDPLTKFFPDYPKPGDEVTVYRLLNHTSGIKSYTGLADWRERRKAVTNHASLIESFRDVEFDFPPGAGYRYNNSGYYLLGVIIEQLSGNSYSGYLRDRVFSWAGLEHTKYGQDTFPTEAHARGYTRVDGAFEEAEKISMIPSFSAGALESTVGDLIRWQRALHGGKVVSRESYSMMTAPGFLDSRTRLEYGFGLAIGREGWRRTIGHGGGIDGFTCSLVYYSDRDVTIALLTNTDNARPARYVAEIAKALFEEPAPKRYDVIIQQGRVVDGTGADSEITDIGIYDGKIAFVGSLEGAKARHMIEAEGLVVAPGFVDVHNHSELAIARKGKRLNEGFVRQGVTTVVGGADGSLGPDQIVELGTAYAEQGVGTNVAFYVGHNAVRRRVLGDSQQREPTAGELARMKTSIRRGMGFGAVGLSTGLMYEPGMFSQMEEVAALAQEVTAFGGIYDSHVRSPVHAFLASHREAADIGRLAGIPSKLGHLKAVGLQNAGLIRDVIAMVEDQRAQGHVVVSDQYPYDGAATSRLRDIVILPKELRGAQAGPLLDQLQDPDRRAQIREASEEGVEGGFAWLKATGYRAMRIVSSVDYPELVGKYLSRLAEERRQEPFDLVAELLISARQPIVITLGAIEEEDVRRLMKQPWNMIASDGAYVDRKTKDGSGHPRSVGTFPRVLGHYVREEKVLTLEEAIWKMTWLPASTVGLMDRGRIALGLPADITVFDPQTIRDTSTWDEPTRMPDGVLDVLVNGVPVLRKGKMTGEAPGIFLRRGERYRDK